jgi:hypothetical protein
MATWGGLSQDLLLGWIPHQTPSFTLFEDGTYIRRQSTVEWDHVEVEWRRGYLDRSGVDAFLGRLVAEARFFEIPASPPAMSCATDGPEDYLYLSTAGQTHRVRVYGLSWYNPEWTCGWSVADNLLALAEIVHTFENPLAPGETEVLFDRGTIAATERSVDSAPPWPIAAIRLADLPDAGWYRSAPVEGDLVTEIAAALEPDSWDGTFSRFEEGGQDWLVGLRREFPGWDTYR